MEEYSIAAQVNSTLLYTAHLIMYILHLIVDPWQFTHLNYLTMHTLVFTLDRAQLTMHSSQFTPPIAHIEGNTGKTLVFTISWFILDFFQYQNVAIPSPDQPAYNLTWHIRFSKPKLNIFADDISWYHTSKKGALSIETKWITFAH